MEEAFHGFLNSDDDAETTIRGTPGKSSQVSKKQAAPMVVAVSEEEGIAREEAVYARDRAAKSIRKNAEWIANAKIITYGEVEVRRRVLEQLWTEFRQMQLLLREESSIDDETEEFYYGAAAKLCEKGEPSGEVKETACATTNKLKLPKLTLATFGGAYEAWLPFHDLYKQVVHENNSISNVEKAYYLRSFLVGEPLKIVESYPIADNTYEASWEALVDRYANKYLLKKKHTNELILYPRVKNTTVEAIHGLINCCETQVKVLAQLGEDPSQWGILLTQIVLLKLDAKTQLEWEKIVLADPTASYPQLMAFLKNETRLLDAVQENKPVEPAAPSRKPLKLAVHLAAEDKPRSPCAVCNENHSLAKCDNFKRLPGDQKNEIVRKNKLCSNCLSSGHYSRSCFSKFRCQQCGKKHHTVLHGIDQFGSTSSAPSSPNVTTISASATVAKVNKTYQLMTTAVVHIRSVSGEWLPARALLDGGAQSNLITEDLCQRLGLKGQRTNVTLSAVGDQTLACAKIVTTDIASKVGDYQKTLSFLALPKITGEQPAMSMPDNIAKPPRDMRLADPKFNKRSGIDILLGQELFYDIHQLQGPCMQFREEDGLTFVNTKFGWVVSGQVKLNKPDNLYCNACFGSQLEELMERFWKIEEILPAPILTPEEQECEGDFKRHCYREEDGRYVVKLPLRPGFEGVLGGSREAAHKRFMQLERRLNREPMLRTGYDEVMRNYLDAGYLREATNESPNLISCYLPHHPVVKASSSTTKIRPVFDGSAKTTSGKSLNDCLLTGPVIQDTLFNLVLRFRCREVALTADIEKMYLQVKVHPDHTSLQRILWRFGSDDVLKTYELQRVTFGLAPSSFLATRVLHQLAEDEGGQFPLAQRALQSDFYVDDYIGGADNDKEAAECCKELRELLIKGGFRLRKWVSNHPWVLNDVQLEDRQDPDSVSFGDSSVKALGLVWNPKQDCLSIEIHVPGELYPITRRSVYSMVARLFDPLGLIAPVIAWAKMRMQQLWISGKGWDDSVTPEIAAKWLEFLHQIPFIRDVQVPRYAFVSAPVSIQLHCFSDASEAGYGACLYVRTVDQGGRVRVEFMAAKSRPSPLKRVSIARLELCGALMAAKLWATVSAALALADKEAVFWTDSTIVLHWVRAPSYYWTTYVANRVSKIQELTQDRGWRHVKGVDNPADILSRGTLPEELMKAESWINGPSWLKANTRQFYDEAELDAVNPDELERKKVVLIAAAADKCVLLERYSCYWKTLRITALCLKFVRRCRGATSTTKHSFLTATNLKEARTAMVKAVQLAYFPEELKELSRGKELPKGSQLRKLQAFLDPEGFLRVGGRLRQVELEYSKKHPLVLPGKCHFTKLVAVAYHEMTLHSGPTATLGSMRNEFWPLKGRSLVNQVCRRCFTCYKLQPVPVEQPPGQIPAKRATPSRPFSVVGVDYCGPILLKPVHRRAAPQKAYIAIFVCFAVKAVHIELVEDLSTPAFLSAFRRFVSRKGLPTDVYSDNGLNFRGASNSLRELYGMFRDEQAVGEIVNHAASRGVEWHFIPPKAPNFGGLWEAAVKAAKRTLQKVIGTRRLSFGDMSTVLAQIEAQLNSRPLPPLSEDPSELDVLTPGHFLMGTAPSSIPEEDVTRIPENRLKHYQQLQQLIQQHWKRWRTEYLSELHNSSQRVPEKTSLSVGQMVLLKEDTTMPLEWPLARIVEVHPGADGIVRVVTIRTKQGIFRRPVSRICLLPFEKENVG